MPTTDHRLPALAGLDAVPWGDLQHNRGTATDVPGLLGEVTSEVPDKAGEAAFALEDVLYHQGGWVCSAAAAAVPFLVALAGEPAVTVRVSLLELVESLLRTAGEAQPRWVDAGWAVAWEGARPGVVSLLADADPLVRRAAVAVLGAEGKPPAGAVDVLLECWRSDGDLATRVAALEAAGRLVVAAPEDAARVGEALRALFDDPSPALRVAAVHAWAGFDAGIPLRHLDLLVEGLTDPRAATEFPVAWPGRTPAHLAADTFRLVAGDQVTATRFVTRLAGTPAGVETRPAGTPAGAETRLAGARAGADPADPGDLADRSAPADGAPHGGGLPRGVRPDEAGRLSELRGPALQHAGALLSLYRSPTETLLPVLAGSLADPDPECRVLAAHLLGALGTAAAAHADALVEHLDDAPAGGDPSEETVADNARWALTRLHDPRGLPDLVATLYRRQAVFAPHGSYYPRDSFYFPTLPGLHEVLIPLREQAATLLPGLRQVMRAAAGNGDWEARRACAQVLAAWDADAVAALPELVAMLADERLWRFAVEALAAMGPAAASALPALRRSGSAAAPAPPALQESGPGVERDLLLWARWRLGDDPGPALAALASEVAADGVAHASVRRLGTLGALAAAQTDRLRELSTASVEAEPSWVEVEAAIALHSVSGEPGTAAAVLEAAVRPLGDGVYLPVMPRAVEGLTHIATITAGSRDTITPETRDALHRALALDRRLASSGGWRAFAEDEEIRAAVTTLLAAAR